MRRKLSRTIGSPKAALSKWAMGPIIRLRVGFVCASCAAAFVLAALVWPAFAGLPDNRRVALVIGNGAYANAPKLDNSVYDAKAVADAFRRLGFQVVDGYDLDIAQMRAKVSEFAGALPGAKSAVVYYAGHGISVDDENYLIPTDIRLKSPTDLDLGSLSVSLILKQMKREDRVNIVVLDACRDNPFAAALARAKTRAIVGEHGLSRIDGDLARGTLIAFASDPKSTALDGPPGHHSPFTEAFLDHVFDPGVSIDTVMSRVRTEVWEKTDHAQLPWVNTSLIGDYALNPAPLPGPSDVAKSPADAASATSSGDERLSKEDLLWESAQHSNLSADYQAYLDAFPHGTFSQMAKNKIASLRTAPAPSASDWKTEIGTADTESALNLTPSDEKEIQQRLTAIGLYKGPATGVLDPATRAAIAEWQKTVGIAPTSFLGPIQLTALRHDTESAYQRAIASQPAVKPAERRAQRPSVKPAERSARAPARMWAAPVRTAPVRHAAKHRSQETTASASAPAAPADPGGTPEWRRRAGLPVEFDLYARASAGLLTATAGSAMPGLMKFYFKDVRRLC